MVRPFLKNTFLLFFCIFSSQVYAVGTPTAPVNPACPQEVAGVHGARLKGADTYTSDIVINACVALGGNAQQLIQRLQDNVCTITSGYRSPQHNAEVGGASASQHVQGRAIDVVVRGDTLRFGQLLLAGLCCKNRCIGGMGYYNRNLFHVDNRQSVAAWGPDYTTTGIAQIQDPQMRNLLNTYVRNGANIRLPDGEPIVTASGDIQFPSSAPTHSPPPPVVVNEDGGWSNNGVYSSQPAPQPQPVPPVQQQTVYTTQPYTTQTTNYQQPTTLPTVVASGVTPYTGTSGSLTKTDIFATESSAASLSKTKPSVLCTKTDDGSRLTIQWSCGSTQAKKVWVEGRGFNARRAPLGTVQVPFPKKNTTYSIECYSNSKIIARSSCIVKVPKKVEPQESFQTKEESASDQGSLCIFKTCLW